MLAGIFACRGLSYSVAGRGVVKTREFSANSMGHFFSCTAPSDSLVLCGFTTPTILPFALLISLLFFRSGSRSSLLLGGFFLSFRFVGFDRQKSPCISSWFLL